MKLKLNCYALLAGLGVGLLSPVAVTAGPVVQNQTVEKVRVRSYVSYVKLSGCSKYNKIYLTDLADKNIPDQYGLAMYSAALTAHASGKKVNVQMVDEDGCHGSESTFTYFEISN